MQLFDNNEPGHVMKLSELTPGQHADVFVLLASKERKSTRDDKPYFRVAFRDAARSATAMIWSDAGWFADCETAWEPGRFYKLRCNYSDGSYGPQVEIERIREVTDEDRQAGFDEREFFETSRYDNQQMFDELRQLVAEHIEREDVRALVERIIDENADAIRHFPAASRNHHAYDGGFLEHVLSVTKTCIHLADKYRDYYSNMQPPLDKSLVIAGAVLHDIGKLRELETFAGGAKYSPQGRLVGHILLGRDMVREAAGDLDSETLLRIEHIIVSHQNLPEWGSPIAPHTPEALIVHYADDLDAKFHMVARVLEGEPSSEPFTPRDNPLRRPIFRGLP